MDIRQTGGQADGSAEPIELFALFVLLVRRQQDQDAVGHHFAVEMAVMLRGGQNGEAVVHRVGHAGGVVHLHEVGHEAGGDDDAQNDFGQLVGDGVGLAVLHCLAAPADDGLGAHGAEGDAHGVAVGGDMAAGGNGGFVMLGHRIAHAGPQVDLRCIGNDLRVDEDMLGRDLGEGIFPQAAVGMIHDAQAGAGSAGGGDGGEGKEGAVGLLGQHLAGVDGLAAAHREDHVRSGHLRFEHIHVFAGSLAAVPEGTDHFQAGLFSRSRDVGTGSFQGPLAADDGGGFAVGGAYVCNVFIGVRADGISGKQTLLHD